MWEKEKHDLQRLDEFDRWRVVNHWRRILWMRYLKRLPLPGKLGLVNTGVFMFSLFVIPPVRSLPPIFMPLLWTASYTFSLSICMLLPLKTQRPRQAGM